MKIRNGFVSNSSSSSFVCDACGETVTGWDVYGRSCENEHTFCECCFDMNSEVEKYIKNTNTTLIKEALIKIDWKEEAENWDEMDDEDKHEVIHELFSDTIPSSLCPACNFEIFCQGDVALYLEKEYKISKVEAFAEIKKANKRRKKLYDNEYNLYVCEKIGKNFTTITNEIKGKFGNFDGLMKFISGETI